MRFEIHKLEIHKQGTCSFCGVSQRWHLRGLTSEQAIKGQKLLKVLHIIRQN